MEEKTKIDIADLDALIVELGELVREVEEIEEIDLIGRETIECILKKSAYSLPDRPSEAGMTPAQIKATFYRPILDTEQSLLAEVNRVIGEANDAALGREVAEVCGKLISICEICAQIRIAIATLDDVIADHNNAKNPHGIDAEAVGLGNVDNTSDEEKPLSAAAREAITKTLDDAKEYADETKVGKSGDQVIGGSLSIGGDLLVKGNTYAKQIESLEVGDAVIVANADGVLLSELSGYVIRVRGDSAYAIVYDPVDECVKIGLGTYDGERKLFTFTEGEAQVLATRDRIADGHIPVWDDEKKTFKDSGKKADEFIPKDSAQLYTNALKGSAIGEAVVITDISPVEHDMRVNVKSKNVIPFPFVGGWLNTSGGVAFTYNDDNTIRVKGTTQKYSYTHLIGNDVDKDSVSPYLEDGKIYTLSLQAMNGETTLPSLIITYTEKATGKLNYVNSINPTFTVDKSKYTYDYMRLFISSVGVELDCVVGAQLEKDTTATAYTPYIADTEAVNIIEYGKNLLPPINATITVDGVTAEFKDGFVSFSGSVPEGETVMVRYTFSKDERKAYPAGKYIIGNFRNISVGSVIAGVVSVETGKFVVNINSGGKTVNEAFAIEYVQIMVKENLIGKTIPLIMMVNTNNQGFDAEAEYEPYKEPIEYSQGEAIKPIYPTTTITTDTVGALVEVEYNRDINKAFAKMQEAIILLGGII